MTRYIVIPFPLTQIRHDEKPEIAHVFEEIKKQTQQRIAKEGRRSRKGAARHSIYTEKAKATHPEVLWFTEDDARYSFSNAASQLLKDGDILEIHAEGTPYTCGSNCFGSSYELTPYALAERLAGVLSNRDLQFTIDLLFCNSGTRLSGDYSYVEMFVERLKQLGFTHVTAYGYAGYLNVKSTAKLSVFADPNPPSRPAPESASIEDARAICSMETGYQAAKRTLCAEAQFRHLEEDKACVLKERAKGFSAGTSQLIPR